MNLVEWIYSFQYWVLRIFEQPLVFEARRRFRYSGDNPFESDTPYWVYILMIVGAILLVTGLTSMVLPSRSGFRDDAENETIWDMFMGVVQIIGKIFPAEYRSWGIRLLGLMMFLLGILVSIPVLYWMDQDDDGRLKEYYVEEGTGDLTTETPERVKPAPTPSVDKSKSPAEHIEIAEGLMEEAATYWQQSDMENSLKKAKEALDYLNASVGSNHRKTLQAKQMYQSALEKYNTQ